MLLTALQELPDKHLAGTALGRPRLQRLLGVLHKRHEPERSREHHASRLRPLPIYRWGAVDQPRQLRELHQTIPHPHLQWRTNQQRLVLRHAECHILRRPDKLWLPLVPILHLHRSRAIPSRAPKRPIAHLPPAAGELHAAMVRMGFPTRAVQHYPVYTRLVPDQQVRRVQRQCASSRACRRRSGRLARCLLSFQ